jgi:hypothetical protein
MSFILNFLLKFYIRSSSRPFTLHALSISSSLTGLFCLAKSISYEAPHYGIFLQPPTTSSFLSFCSSCNRKIDLHSFFIPTIKCEWQVGEPSVEINGTQNISIPFWCKNCVISRDSRCYGTVLQNTPVARLQIRNTQQWCNWEVMFSTRSVRDFGRGFLCGLCWGVISRISLEFS